MLAERGIGDNGGPELEPIVLEFTDPQFDLITSTSKFPAMVAGFGAGKTEALVERAVVMKLNYPDNDIAYYLPTYDLISAIAIPRFVEILDKHGLIEGEDFKVVSSIRPRIEIFDGGQIIFRSMDNPSKIIGYEVADSLVDELDTLKTEDARLVWQKILSRNRQKKKDGSSNTIAVGTTPEGFRFVYEKWKKEPPSDDYQIIRASTYSNERNLPDDYIQNLLDDYPSSLIEAYVEGEFVNLTSGSVYPQFDRKLNATTATIQPGEALHIGMDFNVGKMAAVVFVQRQGNPYALNELTGLLDTPEMINAIKRKFPNHAIYVYPDASGNARKSQNASSSDLSLLKQAGFNVLVNKKNPFVRDRIIAVNRMICVGDERRLMVNIDLCPSFVEGLEKQAYDDKGEPDKSSGLDHSVDGGGYFICYRFPVLNRKVIKTKVGGV
jgi:hypothetical protein